MTSRTNRLAALTLLGLSALLALEAMAARGGGKPKPPPTPASPAIAYVVPWTQIWVMDADGGNQTRIHEGTSFIYSVSWSRDGKQLAYNQNGELWRIDVAVVDGVPRGSNATQLHADTGYRIHDPDWSPLGDEIVFATRSTDGQDRTDIRMVPANGGSAAVVYVSPQGHDVGHPLWSPDGKRLAFVEGTGGAGLSFRVLTLSTGADTTVLTGWQNGLDGLAHARTKDVIAIQSGNSATGGKVYTLDLVTGVTQEHFAGSGAVAWSPDDTRLVFDSLGKKYGFSDGLWTCELSTGRTEKLAGRNGGGYGRWPDWRR